MREFMLLVRNDGNHTSALSAHDHQAFLKKCESYIGALKAHGQLIAAQPLAREGIIVSGSTAAWKQVPLDATTEIQVGYYHILAQDMDDALVIAKRNPEFEYGTTASVEVRPIKTSEETTGYVYPRKG